MLDARLTGEIAERSIAGQIEFWANLGRAIEPLLQGHQALALSKRAAAIPLSQCVKSVNTPAGRALLIKYLETLPYPHYEPVPNRPGFLVRIDAAGKRATGRFVNRRFQAAAPKKSPG